VDEATTGAAPLGRRPTSGELDAFRNRTIADLLPDPLRLLFVGINPSLWSAATGAHFARPGNRFYPAHFRAGLLGRQIDASAGLADRDRLLLEAAGIGTTNLVARATARADELSIAELRDGARRVTRLVQRHRPRVVAVVGVTAYRKAFSSPGARLGRQPEALTSSLPPATPTPHGIATELWVLPNPSGLNAHYSLDDLAVAYRAVGIAAGIAEAPT
jgi:TDG/mug DNA glycosylase family protein